VTPPPTGRDCGLFPKSSIRKKQKQNNQAQSLFRIFPMKTLLSHYKSSSLKEFAVLLYSRDAVRGCFFRKKGSAFELKSYGKHPLDPENPSEGFRQLKKT
jgi:hypothetical protein